MLGPLTSVCHWRYTAASPNTKATAQRLAEELERHARRQLAGLEALPPRDGGGTVAELQCQSLAESRA